MIRTKFLMLLCVTLASTVAGTQSSNNAPLQVPAKSLPVPTDVSPEMEKLIAAPRNPNWDHLWKTGEEWRKAADEQAAKAVQALPALRQRLYVSIKADTINGVRVFIVTPDVIPPEQSSRSHMLGCLENIFRHLPTITKRYLSHLRV